MEDINIGIIGFGNMGSCIAERIKSFGYQLWTFDKDKSKTEHLSGIRVAEDNLDLVKRVDAVILAVKPQDFSSTLAEIKNSAKGKLIISIAAGITTEYIQKVLYDAKSLENVRVIRTMPNMPARIGQGMTCLCKGKFATDEDLDFVKCLFDNLGKTLIISNEEIMDAATAVSGSGPGYFYDLLENKNIDINNKQEFEKFSNKFILSLAAAAEDIGFDFQEAMLLAKATTDGSIALLKESRLPLAELKKQIVSKGGTTEAALNILHKGGSLKEAVEAAFNRATQLARR